MRCSRDVSLRILGCCNPSHPSAATTSVGHFRCGVAEVIHTLRHGLTPSSRSVRLADAPVSLPLVSNRMEKPKQRKRSRMNAGVFVTLVAHFL